MNFDQTWYMCKGCVYIITLSVHFFYSDMLQRDSLNADAIYVRGMCLYYNDSVDKAYQHFQQVLRLAPDHMKAKEIYKVRILEYLTFCKVSSVFQ